MQLAPSNGLELCYDTFGDPAGEPLLLVMGYTAQMIAWSEGFCEELASRGFHVIRFDNRDCGLSTKSDGTPPDVMALMAKNAAGEAISPDEVPYTLSDMALDAVGLLDHLSIETAHVAGASMGGMIVQMMAIEHADRLRSVTSIMSTTGNQEVGQADPEAMTALLLPPPEGREAILAQNLKTNQIIAGPLWERDEAMRRGAEAFDRSFHPVGAAFQLAAIAATGDRTERLASVDLPFLVIHGKRDSLIGVSGGRATAEAVPHADLLELDAMGHDIPEPLWGQVAGAIHALAHRAGLSY